MDLIGPISMTYYEKIKVDKDDERNILLLGDYHFDVYFSKKCCNHDEIIEKLKTYGDLIQKLLDILRIATDLYFLPKEIGTEQGENRIEELNAIHYANINFKNDIINLLDEYDNTFVKDKESTGGKTSAKFNKLLKIAIDKCNESLKENIIKLKKLLVSENEKKCVLICIMKFLKKTIYFHIVLVMV